MELNENQQQVVDHKSGPLLVVAGAGTGKTRVIVEKIGKLLDEGIEPKSILAVTFTEKAASEMLDRILEARSGLLLDLPVMTFNGYGHSVLREFGINIGLSSSARLLGPQAQIVFFREKIEEFNLDYFLPLASSPDGIIEDILRLISRLKQNLVTPDSYIKFADNLPEDDEAQTLDKKKHTELAKAFDTYIKLCRRDNVIDYDDQIYLTIKLLESRPNVQKQLQDRYHTIFIDEFQDTNPMQSRLIDLIARTDGELVVVGDDDQSIYGFRGATIQNILGFKNRYPDAKEVVLTENYRSHQAILDSSYSLIKHNNPHRLEAELNISKRLTSKEDGSEPRLVRFSDTDSELIWIAKDIAESVSTKGKRSIAVLTRSNSTANAVHIALDNESVDHRVVGASPDLYKQPAVRMLIELARTLAEPDNNASLHHTLVSEVFNIPNELIAPLASKAQYEHESLEGLLSELKEKNLIAAIELIIKLREESGTLSIGQILWKAVSESGYKDRIFKKASEEDHAGSLVGDLNQYFKSLKEFESIAIQPTAGQYLLSLPALMAAGETTDNTLDISEDVVTVTTVHKAKGLEWDTVYIPYLTEASFPMRPQGTGIAVPDELKVVKDGPADDHYLEERRVLYVAATRARHNLTISYSDKGRTGTTKKPSRFIDELFGDGASVNTAMTEVGETADQIVDQIELPRKVSIPNSILSGETVRLSVSQAQVLLTCPLNFYYKFVLRAPEEPTTSTDYGSQLHNLFEQINVGRRDGNMPELSILLEDLKLGWNKAGYSSKTQQERAYERAKNTVKNFYNQALSDPAPYLIEHPFEVSLPGDIVLHGRIDVVYQTDDGVEIQDYKTGDSVKDDKKAKQKAQSSQQLTMYALAWQKQTGEIPKVSLRFPDTNQFAKVAKQQKSLDTIETNLQKAVDNLRSGKFPPGSCQHDYCIHPEIS
jgi:DNA helicase-2/ATP-dependent DNA helicase PcrA